MNCIRFALSLHYKQLITLETQLENFLCRAHDIMEKATYITASFTKVDGEAYEVPLSLVRITLSAPPAGKRKQYDSNGEEMK